MSWELRSFCLQVTGFLSTSLNRRRGLIIIISVPGRARFPIVTPCDICLFREPRRVRSAVTRNNLRVAVTRKRKRTAMGEKFGPIFSKNAKIYDETDGVSNRTIPRSGWGEGRLITSWFSKKCRNFRSPRPGGTTIGNVKSVSDFAYTVLTFSTLLGRSRKYLFTKRTLDGT